MKIKKLLEPILEQLNETIETYGENEYDYNDEPPHLELMYGDTYYTVMDIYFMVEDDGDVVLRINTDHLINIERFRIMNGGGGITDNLTGFHYTNMAELCSLLNQVNRRADRNAEQLTRWSDMG